jgi:uncharacterized protein
MAAVDVVAADAGPLIAVEVVYSPAPREVRRAPLTLPAGSTLMQALVATGWADLPALDKHVGIWGRRAQLDSVLQDQDRVEVYRSLKVDPKEARRVRYRAHGEKLPKGYHRPRAGAKDMTLAPDKRVD